MLSFTANVVSEDAILKWFKDGHSQKGKMHFLEQMKKFIEWLQNAEEGKRIHVVTDNILLRSKFFEILEWTQKRGLTFL